MYYRNFNDNFEDCKEINFFFRDFNDLYDIFENYINGYFVDFLDLKGVSEGKEFVKNYEDDRNVY